MGEILKPQELLEARRAAAREGGVFVFTNGCFDILHRGHVELLAAAAAQGDMLAVGLNSDSSVRRLKGRRRPVTEETDRAAVLAALECVDFVTVFDEDTPQVLIDLIRPDVLVKGSDYDLNSIIGREEVEEAGGRVVIVDLYGDYSTEKILRRVARLYREFSENDGRTW
jgi:D-beta-D-heptose 7-phosphate kinase/D-beta-D-heptose 1-phosphate adenosyltransferase